MMLLRFIVLAGLIIAIGVAAPARATMAGADALPGANPIEQKKDSDVPRPRPTPGPKDMVLALSKVDADIAEQKKKADPPPRRAPSPAPKTVAKTISF